jgi:ABC-type lipoprotein release transport system permease subunit
VCRPYLLPARVGASGTPIGKTKSTGLVVGAPIAVWSRHVAASLPQNLPASSALPIAFAAVAMIAIALLAAYLPARRAARVRPMDALRHS